MTLHVSDNKERCAMDKQMTKSKDTFFVSVSILNNEPNLMRRKGVSSSSRIMVVVEGDVVQVLVNET